MSIGIDIDERMYDKYVMECRVLSEQTGVVVVPTLKDFVVWAQEADEWDYEVDASYER